MSDSRDAWVPKLSGNIVYAINARTGATREFSCNSWGGALSASNASSDEIVIQTEDGPVLIWNVRRGNYRQIRG